MPNHYQNILICRPAHSRDDYEFDCQSFLEKYGETNLCAMIRPRPKELDDPSRPHILTDAAYHWQEENWGVTWGTYNTQAFELKGDGSPVVISFVTPWGPPRKMMPRIVKWLRESFDFGSILWIGSDPMDDRNKVLFSKEADE